MTALIPDEVLLSDSEVYQNGRQVSLRTGARPPTGVVPREEKQERQ